MNASISFMVPHAKHREEKPYAIQYEPHDPLPRINYEHEMISNIPVADIRMQSHPCSLRDEGFTVLTMESALTADEFIDEQKLKEVYAAEVRSLLTKHLGCSQVYFHECVVGSQYPVSCYHLTPQRNRSARKVAMLNRKASISPKKRQAKILDSPLPLLMWVCALT